MDFYTSYLDADDDVMLSPEISPLPPPVAIEQS
jgi:hypothetical protein